MMPKMAMNVKNIRVADHLYCKISRTLQMPKSTRDSEDYHGFDHKFRDSNNAFIRRMV